MSLEFYPLVSPSLNQTTPVEKATPTDLSQVNQILMVEISKLSKLIPSRYPSSSIGKGILAGATIGAAPLTLISGSLACACFENRSPGMGLLAMGLTGLALYLEIITWIAFFPIRLVILVACVAIGALYGSIKTVYDQSKFVSKDKQELEKMIGKSSESLKEIQRVLACIPSFALYGDNLSNEDKQIKLRINELQGKLKALMRTQQNVFAIHVRYTSKRLDAIEASELRFILRIFKQNVENLQQQISTNLQSDRVCRNVKKQTAERQLKIALALIFPFYLIYLMATNRKQIFGI